MNITSILDCKTVGEYQRKTVAPNGWIYNQSIFTSDLLENTEHLFVVLPQASSGSDATFLVFDYFSYECVVCF